MLSILPPYNTVHAQLVKLGEPPQVITSGVTLTYEAAADTTGSKNTISSTKTNFWSTCRRCSSRIPRPTWDWPETPCKAARPIR